MSLQLNLVYAEEAIKYVESKLRGGASNRGEDKVHRMLKRGLPTDFGSVLSTAYQVPKSEVNKLVGGSSSAADLMNTLPKNKYTGKSDDLNLIFDLEGAYHHETALSNRTADPKAIEQRGVGNCFEHSVLAADYLSKKDIPANVFIVQTLDEPDPWECLDHVWVIIGLTPPPTDGVHETTLETSPNWGADAVVCDAWYNEWFSVQQDWARKMRSILRITNHSQNALPEKVNLEFERKH